MVVSACAGHCNQNFVGEGKAVRPCWKRFKLLRALTLNKCCVSRTASVSCFVLEANPACTFSISSSTPATLSSASFTCLVRAETSETSRFTSTTFPSKAVIASLTSLVLCTSNRRVYLKCPSSSGDNVISPQIFISCFKSTWSPRRICQKFKCYNICSKGFKCAHNIKKALVSHYLA